MKKLTPRFRQWLRVRRRRAAKRYRSKDAYQIGLITTTRGTFAARLGTHGKSPPAIFCFDDNYEETAAFLDLVRRRTVLVPTGGIRSPTSKHRSKLHTIRSYHDFSIVKKVSTSAALVLASLYDVRRHFSRADQPAVNLPEWDIEVRQTMRDLGFFSLLGIETVVPDEVREDQMTARFSAGIKVEPDQVGGPESVLERVFNFIGGDHAKKVSLYTAIIEAMNNVRDHAYPEVYFHQRRHIKNWWFTASADRTTKRVTVSFYDQGISIPVSLPRTRGLESLIRNFLSEFQLRYDVNNPRFDGMAISEAMRPHATATREPNRGFGLAKIREMVDNLPGGRLRIISRNGDFVARAGQQPVSRVCDNSLQGTLVEIEAVFD